MGSIRRMQGSPEREMDTTPIEMPIGASRPRSLEDYIATMVRNAVMAEKQEEFETWEESDDFEEEDPDILDLSRYELQELQEEDSIRDYGPDPDKEFAAPSVGSQEPSEDNSGPADPNSVPAE